MVKSRGSAHRNCRSMWSKWSNWGTAKRQRLHWKKKHMGFWRHLLRNFLLHPIATFPTHTHTRTSKIHASFHCFPLWWLQFGWAKRLSNMCYSIGIYGISFAVYTKLIVILSFKTLVNPLFHCADFEHVEASTCWNFFAKKQLPFPVVDFLRSSSEFLVPKKAWQLEATFCWNSNGIDIIYGRCHGHAYYIILLLMVQKS